MQNIIQTQEVEIQDNQRVFTHLNTSELKNPENTLEFKPFASNNDHTSARMKARARHGTRSQSNNCRISSYPT